MNSPNMMFPRTRIFCIIIVRFSSFPLPIFSDRFQGRFKAENKFYMMEILATRRFLAHEFSASVIIVRSPSFPLPIFFRDTFRGSIPGTTKAIENTLINPYNYTMEIFATRCFLAHEFSASVIIIRSPSFPLSIFSRIDSRDD